MVVNYFQGILMDYHIIFMLIAIGLMFFSLVLVFYVKSKDSMLLAMIFLGINQIFLMATAMGFLGIGYLGYNETSGQSTVLMYSGMFMFAQVFTLLMFLNGLLLFIAIVKHSMLVHKEESQNYKIYG